MKDNYLDSHNPYIKNNIHGIEKTRANILAFSTNENKGSSDTLLRQKITNISKKIVGEEIKKFAEVASHEISTEFSNLENRILDNVNNTLDYKVKENVDFLGRAIGKELDIKLQELNILISEIETKVENLDYFSKSLEEKIDKNTNEYKSTDNEPIFKIETIKKDEKKTSLTNEKKQKEEKSIDLNQESPDTLKEKEDKEIIDTDFSSTLSEDDPLYTKKVNYINEKIKAILPKFEKSGFLFKKNTFITSIKNLNTKDFLKNREEYTDLDIEDKDKIEEILNNLKNELNIEPNEEENIGDYLKKCYLKKYIQEK